MNCICAMGFLAAIVSTFSVCSMEEHRNNNKSKFSQEKKILAHPKPKPKKKQTLYDVIRLPKNETPQKIHQKPQVPTPELKLGVLEKKKKTDRLEEANIFKVEGLNSSMAYKKMLGENFVKEIPERSFEYRYLNLLAIHQDGNYLAWPERDFNNVYMIAYAHVDNGTVVHKHNFVGAQNLPQMFFDNNNILLALANTNPHDYYLPYSRQDIELYVIDVAQKTLLKKISFERNADLRGNCLNAMFDPSTEQLVARVSSWQSSYNVETTVVFDRDIKKIAEIPVLMGNVMCCNNDGSLYAFSLPGESKIILWQPDVQHNNGEGLHYIAHELITHSSGMMFDRANGYLIIISSHTSSITAWDVSNPKQSKLVYAISDPWIKGELFAAIHANRLVQIKKGFNKNHTRSSIILWDYATAKKKVVGQIEQELWSPEAHDIHSDKKGNVYICLSDGTILICDFQTT